MIDEPVEVSQKPSNVSISTSQFTSQSPFLYLALGMIFYFMWIGDSSFINDEPLLLQMALKANDQGDFFTLGLMGTKGLQYGPVPIWFYRSLLVLTHDIYLLAFLKTFLQLIDLCFLECSNFRSKLFQLTSQHRQISHKKSMT
ncbi:MAG: hypothetical protein AABY86_04620, partial [Bdellovibrionota bacterium]